jgi:hypothetical protein
LDLVRQTAVYDRVKPNLAERILREVQAAVESWRHIAADAGIARDEIELMANAFTLS